MKDDVITYIYQEILCLNVTEYDVGGAQAAEAQQLVAKDKKEHEERLKAIRERVQAGVDLTDPIEFERAKQREIDAEKKQYSSKRRVAAAPKALADRLQVRGAGGLGSGEDDDPMLPILHELILEVEAFFMEVHVPKTKGDNPYGDPLAAKGKSCRYSYWPSKRKVFPILYFCALQLLGGRCATVTNERIHSPATRITQGLRGCLKPKKTERLTLSFFFLREEVKALVAQIPPLPGLDPFDFDEAAVDKLAGERYPAYKHDDEDDAILLEEGDEGVP